MAIKVGGTTVIDDSRQLTNIASVDAATVTALSNAGVGAGGGKFTATADGAISIGDTVSLQSDGTVKSVSQTIIELSTPTFTEYREVNTGSLQESYGNLHYYNGYYLYIYSTGTDIIARVFTHDIAANTITIIGARFMADTFVQSLNSALDPNTGHFLLSYRNSANNTNLCAGYIDSNGALSGGTAAGFSGASTRDQQNALAFSTTDNKFRLLWGNSNNNTSVATLSVSGTTSPSYSYIGEGLVQSSGQAHGNFGFAWDSNNNRFMVTERQDSVSDYGRAFYISTDASTGAVTIHHQLYFETSYYVTYTRLAFNPEYNKFTVVYSNGSNVTRAKNLNLSGTSFTVSNSVEVAPLNVSQAQQIAYDPISHNMGYVWSGDSTRARFRVIDVSGTDPSPGSIVDIRSNAISTAINLTYNSDSDAFAVTSYRFSNTDFETVQTTQVDSNNTDWIGFASEPIADAGSGDILVLGSTDENQSGLTAGSTYYVQTDGSLSTETSSAIKVGRALSSTKLLITEGNAQ